MGNSNNNYIDLRIEGAGTKIEDSKTFKSSYYSYEYKWAFHSLYSILKAEETSQKENSYRKDESYNIIAFIGARGSGKSSAMESFAGALSRGSFSYLSDELSKYFFYTLPSIDGSLLESREDIFKITLGQMYGELVRLNEKVTTSHSSQRILDFQKREVQKSFVDLYRSACKMEGLDENIEEATITTLKNLSNSLKLRKDFKDIVKQYLNLICEMGAIAQDISVPMERRYLVISIDDLDLNILNGYEMLEKIHRYLMVPGVIVLMSMDLIQLKMLCEGGFYEMVPKVNKILKQRQVHIGKLATEYTDKVLPIGSRIYMPDFKHRTNLRICCSDSSESNLKEEAKSLKEYFFAELYKKSGMRFDQGGEKWHFYVPETMRGTVNFYLMLNQIHNLTRFDNEISEWNPDDWNTFNSNYTYLIGDIRNRMVVDKLTLDDSQYQQFQLWADNQLDRTCMAVVKYVSHLAKTGDDEEKERLSVFRKDYLSFEYSYGELLRSLYLWGRTKSSNKRIVHCILADLTAQMTKSYYDMLQYDCVHVQDQGKEDYKNPFKEKLSWILNGSMLGSWSNLMLPLFVETVSTSFISTVGALNSISIYDIDFVFNISKISGASPEEILAKNASELEECQKIFRTMELFAMFFTEKIYKNTPTMSWEIIPKEDPEIFFEEGGSDSIIQQTRLANTISKPENTKTVHFKSGFPAFNMYGFMANLFDWEKKEKTLEETLYDCLFVKEQEKTETNKAYEKTKKKFLKKIGIQEDMKKWYRLSAGFVLPFYSLDITYNILKRMRQDRYGYHLDPKNAKEFYKYYTVTLQKLGERLSKSDEFYGIKVTPSNYDNYELTQSFYRRFDECPFVKWAMTPEKYLVKDFPDMFAKMLRAVVSKSNSNPKPILSPEDEDGD